MANGQAVVSPERLERFILETDPGLMRGYFHSEAPAEAPDVTRRLKALPAESLDIALTLFNAGPPNYENWRLRVCWFLWGMYRTHNVSPSQHRKTVAVIYKEMIQPESRAVDSIELTEGLNFISEWGTAEDLRLLVPLLRNRDPEVREEAARFISGMAQSRHLPDPTKAPLSTPKPIDSTPSPLAASTPIPAGENKSVPKSTPSTLPSTVMAEGKSLQSKYVIAGLALAAVALVVLIKKRRE